MYAVPNYHTTAHKCVQLLVSILSQIDHYYIS